MRTVHIVCVIALLGAIILVTPTAATTWYVHDGESIWDTINGANDGDTVFVYNGTYEVFAINMPNITLEGECADVVTVDCGGAASAIGNEEPHHAPGCIVDGFKFVNSDLGININPGCPDCIIRNCVFEGLSADFAPDFSAKITFVDNTIANSTGSIGFVVPINGSTIVNNTIINGKGNGIVLYRQNPAPGGTIARNNIISNEGKGIWLYDAGDGNEIYLNNFVGNGESVAYGGTPPATIYWNSTDPIEYTHNGMIHTDYLGNYWDDYTGVDTSPEDGIGDAPHDIPGSATDSDHHPLMTGFENYPESHTPTPFLISGSVTYTSGGHVLDPAVTVTNLASGEYFTVTTTTGSNYYLTLTDSTHITAGDTIRINASDGTASSEIDHPVTASDLETGGFVQDMLLEAGDRPDLTVTEKSEDWVSLMDRTYTVTYTAENIGGDDASASTTSITIDGLEETTDSVPALQAGENYTSTVGPFTLSGENDTIEVCSDIADAVDEPDELNNCLENVLEFPDMPELTVTEITTPENIYADVNNVIIATVANTGDADSGAFNVSFATCGNVVDLAAVTNIPAGDSTTVSFDWTPPGTGNHEIRTFADCDLEVPEPDETNNELCENVDAISPNPDLTIAKIALTTPGYANEDNTLVVAVTNAGVLDAGSFTVSLSVDGTPLPDRTVTQLAAGATTNLEYTWTPASTGAHTLYAEADTENAVAELNESNNDFTRTSVIIKRTDWAQFHYDIVHTGFSPSGAPNTNETFWISDEIFAIGGTSTVIADGMVFAYGGPTGWSGEDGALYCLDEFTGAILWNISIPTPAYGSWSSPAYHNGRVFTSTGIEAGCYNAATGEQIWAFENPTNEPGVNGGPVVADGKVIVNDWQAGHYYCLDEETGELLWTFAEGQTGSWAVGYAQGVAAYEDGKFYLTTWLYVGGNVYCVDADTGEEIWNQTTPLDICGSPAVVDGTVYVTNYDFYGDGAIYAMDASDGDVLWQQTIQRTDSTPTVAYGNVYVTGGCKGYSSLQTYCFNAATGDLVWSTDAADERGEFKISVAVADGKVFVGKAATFFEYAGTVALDAFTGDLIWSYPEGGSSPAVADNIAFTIGGGRVYAFGGSEIPAGVTFDRKKLNLNSSGILKAFITLPEGYDVADIDVSTVECEGAHAFGDGSVIRGKQALEVKFKIPDLVDVPTGDAVLLSVTGELTTGERFEGSNTVKVIAK